MKQKEKIGIRWNGLSAYVKQKRILQDCNGYCRPGEMLAIMGPSGAGKTTLLSLICQKQSSSMQIKGQVFANNQSFTSSEFYNFGAFIYQNDILHESLTVRQTLKFAGILKYKTEKEAEDRVDELIKLFELQKCENSFIGGFSGKGISGGEKKRVCVAIEIVDKPSLIVLDEPTSGLDSYKAGSLLRALKKLSLQGCAIIFTIHQPSYLLYSLLSNLILLDKGRTIYQGDSQQISTYMQSLNIKIPLKSTISDFFMWEISTFNEQKNQYKTPLNYENYSMRILPRINQEMKTLQSQSSGYTQLMTVRGFVFMFMTLMGRELTLFIRNPKNVVAVIANIVIGVVIVGLFFINEIPSSQEILAQGLTMNYIQMTIVFIGVQGVCFIVIVMSLMNGVFTVLLEFPNNRQIYFKQTSSKKYYPIAYFLSKIIIQLFNRFVATIFYSSGIYWIIGMQASFSQFIIFLCASIMAGFAGNGMGFFLGALFKTARESSAMSNIIILPLMAFSGMYNKLNSIPSWIQWMQYGSPFKYGLHILLLNQYGDLQVPLGDGNTYKYIQDINIQFSIGLNFLYLFVIIVVLHGFSFLLLSKLSVEITT